MAGEFDLVVSPRLLHELQAVLARERFRRYFTYEEATEYVSCCTIEPRSSGTRPRTWFEAPWKQTRTMSTWSGSLGRLEVPPTFCPSTATCWTSRIGP
jgi:hypothetical protein